MPDDFNRLLALDDSQLEMALLDFKDTAGLEKSDGKWALQLYDRSPTLFEDFIGAHLHNPAVINQLLPRIEADDLQALFRRLYQRVATPERWNQEISDLIEADAPFADIVNAINLRQGDWAVIREEVLIALYKHGPIAFEQQFRYIFNRQYAHYYFKIPHDTTRFRRVVLETALESYFAGFLFRMYSTQEEWEAEVRELIDHPPVDGSISARLTALHPDDAKRELPLELVGQLIETFGEAALHYLASKVNWFIRQTLETMINLEPDSEKLLDALQSYLSMYHQSRQQFRHLADWWVPLLYDRDPALFDTWLAQEVMHNHRAILSILPRLCEDGRYELYRQLYAQVATPESWNDQLGSLVRSRLSAGKLEYELTRLDIRQNRYTYQNLTISDENAAALYRRGPDSFREFIWKYLAVGTKDYPLLREAAKNAKDKDFANRLFRKVSSPEAWNEEMRRLLDEDVPPENILEELEKRKPTRIANLKPVILKQFMEKYGEAVLPFFETYIDWTSPKRLNALFNLGLERGELLKELQAIARRQPMEFSNQADLWAMRLYDMSPTFFGAFIARNLGWNAQEIGQKLLRRLEADGQDNLFAELYPRFSGGNDWQREIARLASEIKDDEQLHKAVMRRTRVWGALPDDLAATIYERNPDLFRDFVKAHVGQRWGFGHKYNRLRKAAEKRGDRALLDAVAEQLDPQQSFQQRMEQLLKDNTPPDQIVAALREALPQQSWRVQNIEILVKFIQKYGDAVMPFFIENVTYRYNFNSQKMLDAVRKHANPSNFWRFVFAVNNKGVWNDALAKLAKQKPSADELRARLALLSPPQENNRWNRWSIIREAATTLYRQHSQIARPFLERYLDTVPTELFALAHSNGDEDFLDFLTYRMMLEVQSQMYNAYSPHQEKKFRDSIRKQIEAIHTVVSQRFDRLYAESPELYVRHAAAVFSYVQPFEWWNPRSTFEGAVNPIFDDLAKRHHDQWRRSSAAIKELMESPNIFIQLIGLEILSGGGEDAAARVLENLQAMKALLLGGGRIATKRIVLKCLESAADVSPEAAEKLLPLLAETMSYFARNAIPDDIAVLYARLIKEREYAV